MGKQRPGFLENLEKLPELKCKRPLSLAEVEQLSAGLSTHPWYTDGYHGDVVIPPPPPFDSFAEYA